MTDAKKLVAEAINLIDNPSALCAGEWQAKMHAAITALGNALEAAEQKLSVLEPAKELFDTTLDSITGNEQDTPDDYEEAKQEERTRIVKRLREKARQMFNRGDDVQWGSDMLHTLADEIEGRDE